MPPWMRSRGRVDPADREFAALEAANIAAVLLFLTEPLTHVDVTGHDALAS
jgi:hypothetical protein